MRELTQIVAVVCITGLAAWAMYCLAWITVHQTIEMWRPRRKSNGISTNVLTWSAMRTDVGTDGKAEEKK